MAKAMSAAVIAAAVKKKIDPRIEAAAKFLAAAIRDKLSVPAPSVRSGKRRRGGKQRLRATTPATPGAPPRRLSGVLRASVAVERKGSGWQVSTKPIYGAILEKSGHPYIAPTLKEKRQEIARILKKGK